MFKLKEKNNLGFLWVCISIGIGALVYRGSMELFGGLLQFPFSMLMLDTTDTVVINSLNNLLQMSYSVLSFACASAILVILLNVGPRSSYQPMYKGFHAPLLAPFMIISTVAINFVAAQVNSSLITLLAPDLFNMASSEVAYAQMSVLEMVLMFISTAILPGILEEFVFRGLMLTNLAPYGRGTAILGSALLFGLMHMNPQQFFYTTMMGIILGYVYVRTRSIWVCIAIHILNNGLAVVQEIFFGTMEYADANFASAILTAVVVALGGLSILILLAVRAAKRKKSPAEIGSFGRICEPSLGYEEKPVSRQGKIAMFFLPSNALFTVIVFVSMFTTAGLFLLLGAIYGFIPESVMGL